MTSHLDLNLDPRTHKTCLTVLPSVLLLLLSVTARSEIDRLRSGVDGEFGVSYPKHSDIIGAKTEVLVARMHNQKIIATKRG